METILIVGIILILLAITIAISSIWLCTRYDFTEGQTVSVTLLTLCLVVLCAVYGIRCINTLF